MKYLTRGILRILDANMNRAVEGIRVLEETARMLFDDSELTVSLKDIRHDLVNMVTGEKALEHVILSARDSVRDVLRNGEITSEQTRDGVISIVRANAGRAQQAVRSIEEFIKLPFPSLSEQCKSIRFRLYDVEKSLVLRIHSRELTDKKHLGLYVIIENDSTDKRDIYEITRSVIDEGAGTIAYRDRISNDRAYLTNAESVMDACGSEEVTTIIDNRLDVAIIIGADGICLGSDSFPVKACRSVAGEGFVIGSMIHKTTDFNQESVDGTDYLFLDHYCEETTGGSNDLTILKDFVSQSSIPVIVSYRVSDEYLKCVLDYGVTGIAVKKYCSGAGVKPGEIKKIRRIIDAVS